MSDFFAADPEPARPVPPRPGPGSRRPRPLVLTLIVMAVLLIAFSLFANIWTEKLWFSSIEYGDVFSTLLVTRTVLFLVFGALMGLIVGVNLWLAFRLRPLFRPNSPEQANLERYREVINPVRKVLLFGASGVFALFAGASATGEWRTYLLWRNSQDFGETDAYFNKDIGFYVFTLPWLHWLVDFTMTALIIGLIAAVFVHYVYGGIRLQARTDKVSGPAQAQISVLLGLLVLLKAADYYLDRFDLTSASGSLITGMTYARDNAMLPSKNILMAIAVICAVLFFANVFRRTWMLPGTGLALFVLSAILLGALWPAMVQRFQVKPDEPDKESSYIAKNIAATRDAYNLSGITSRSYTAGEALTSKQLAADAASLAGIRLLDPTLVSDAFEQLQQLRGYYAVPQVLDVDRYQVDGKERDLVVAARELNLEGLPDAQKKWANLHTVYTHGYGMIAAYGNQRNAANQAVAAGGQNDTESGQPVWAERNLPPQGILTNSVEGGYRSQIYFGENSPEYSIVGKPDGGSDVELDVPQASSTDAGEDGAEDTTGDTRVSTYDGKDGVKVGSLFNKLLYAVKFGDPNMVLSSRVHENSKVLYDRSPRERVQKVAPWLTVDQDALPAVVDGKIVWILDAYTVTDRYPNAEKRSLEEMTSDAISPRSAYATLPTDQINYMRNAVKATVDAYDGTVTLYEWDDTDPILKAWTSAFPGVVKAKSSISDTLLDHFRYPEDMYKVQRNLLAEYHVTNPKTFYEGNDKWEVPIDPSSATVKQPPFRLSVATEAGADPLFSLTSVFVPSKKQNLASFMSVGADAADPKTYGKFNILRLPDSQQVPGPSQIANQFSTDEVVAEALRPFKQADATVQYGNLLTLPIGGGLLYVQPLYTVREGGSGKFPVLTFVLASFGKDVGIGKTLNAALADVMDSNGGGSVDPGDPVDPGEPIDPNEPAIPATTIELLQQANAKFEAADAALKAGNLAAYGARVKEAEELVRRALEVSSN